jgi:hypothetical protein
LKELLIVQRRLFAEIEIMRNAEHIVVKPQPDASPAPAEASAPQVPAGDAAPVDPAPSGGGRSETPAGQPPEAGPGQ